MVYGEVAKDACFYLHLLGVCLPFNVITGCQLLAIHDVEALEHLDGLWVGISVKNKWT